jgi:UDP-N-acetylmuramate dehydrogenase
LIGRGSNLLISDGKIDRAVIRLCAPAFKKIKFTGDSVVCGGGLSLRAFIKRCVDEGLAGPEKFAGIPGTVGGSVMMNAGTAENGIGGLLDWVKVMDRKGRVSVIKKSGLKLKYRDSGLTGYIILEAAFKLRRADKRRLRREFKERLKEKLCKQDYTAPNAGSIFKNPEGYKYTSGQMLEMSGLKGLKVGGAQISDKHANFIINRGGATFSDVRSLMRRARSVVKKRFGVSLRPEVEILR